MRPDPLYHVVFLAVAAGTLVAASVLSIRGQSEVVLPVIGWALPPLCAMQRLAGMPCPGCGLTRCFVALAHGQLGVAWSYNPAGMVLFPIVAFQVPFRGYQLWRIRRGLTEVTLGMAVPASLALFAFALLGQWTLRLMGLHP